MNTARTVVIIIVALMLGFLIAYSQQHEGAVESKEASEGGGYGSEAAGGYGAEEESGGYGSEAAGGSGGSGSGGEWVVASDGCRWFRKK